MNEWTDDRVVLLRKFFADGLSASQISEKLGAGLSRNAVIGKLHRLGLRRGRTSSSVFSRPIRKQVESPSAARIEKQGRDKGFSEGGKSSQLLKKLNKIRSTKSGLHILANLNAPLIEGDPLAEVTGNAVAKILCITDLNENTCRWPIGNPTSEGFGYCGDQPDEGCSYCPGHRRIAYESVRSRNSRIAAEKAWMTRGKRRSNFEVA